METKKEPVKFYYCKNLNTGESWLAPANEARMFAGFAARFKVAILVTRNIASDRGLLPSEIM